VVGDAGIDQSGRAAEALHIAEAYFDTGNYERAREVLRSSLAENPTDPTLLAQYARAEYLLKNHSSAAHSAYAALSATPDDEFAMRMYALSLDGLGRGYDALWMAWRTVLAHPNEPRAHRLYARLLQKSRQFLSALRVVDEALRLDPNNADALVLRGSILHDVGRLAESTASYQEALSLDAGNAEALNNIAINRLQRGKLGGALRGFLDAAGSDPTFGDLARRNIGVLLDKVLKRVTLVAVLLCLLVAFVGTAYSNGGSTLVLRVAVGLVTVVLIACLTWLHRAMPRRVLSSVSRDRRFVKARIIHATLAAILGACVTVFGGPGWTILPGAVLLIVGLILVRAGLTFGW
jgi:tetratricopeptide (TPR) repeat protein